MFYGLSLRKKCFFFLFRSYPRPRSFRSFDAVRMRDLDEEISFMISSSGINYLGRARASKTNLDQNKLQIMANNRVINT